MNNNLLLNNVINLAKTAGQQILTIYQEAETLVQIKKDASPLTAADLAAHAVIMYGLQQLTPDLPILSEEAIVPAAERRAWQRYWLVDPLDGTREFIEKNGEFTVNIALIDQHQPIMGIVYAPVLARCYFASQGQGAFRQENDLAPQQIHSKAWQGGQVRVVASRHHALEQLKNFLARLGDYAILHQGSALKCCVVAEGAADIYPRLGPTSEWDTAAAQCVLTEAGGALMDGDGNPLRYNCKDSLENPSFLAVGDARYDWLQFWK